MKSNATYFSLIIVLLMMLSAAITVNKTLFGHDVRPVDGSLQTNTPTDTVSVLPDGRTVIHTAGLPGTVTGYAGPVPLDIYISDGRIDTIVPLQNAESPGFFRRASALFAQWQGKTVEEALSVQVDAVSGATFSSTAIINNVDAGLNYYLGHAGGSHKTMPWKLWVAFAVTLAACILPLFVRSAIYNKVQLLANVIVLGFWCGQFLDYSLMLKYLSDGIPLPGGLAAVAMLIAAFIYPLFGKGQHYCNHICPLGSAQILVAQICKYKVKIPVKVLRGLDWFRRILWAVLMLLLWTDCLVGWMDLELFQAFQFESASWWIIGAALLMVALSAIVARPYCRFICPTGSLFKRAENIG